MRFAGRVALCFCLPVGQPGKAQVLTQTNPDASARILQGYGYRADIVPREGAGNLVGGAGAGFVFNIFLPPLRGGHEQLSVSSLGETGENG